MYASKLLHILKPSQSLISAVRTFRVMVVGGTSELGQAVSMLLRSEPAVTSITVHDSSPTVRDVVTDLLHIPAESTLIGITEQEELRQLLNKTDIVLTTNAASRSDRIGQHNPIPANAALIQMIAHHISRLNPMPFVGIATEPINTLLPMAAEIMQRHGKYEPRKLFGLTGVDSLRAEALYASLHGLCPHQCSVPVICGHSTRTAVPLLSQATPHRTMTTKAASEFTEKFRRLGEEIQKDGFTPGLAAAYNILLFTRSIIRAFHLKSQPAISAFVENNDFGTNFFAGRVNLTPDGAGDMHRYANISQFECDLLQKSIQDLRSELFQGKKLLNTVELAA